MVINEISGSVLGFAGPADNYDDPPMSVVIGAAIAHLLESEQNIQDARGEYDPETIQDLCNTSVIGLRYRTSVESRWR